MRSGCAEHGDERRTLGEACTQRRFFYSASVVLQLQPRSGPQTQQPLPANVCTGLSLNCTADPAFTNTEYQTVSPASADSNLVSERQIKE